MGLTAPPPRAVPPAAVAALLAIVLYVPTLAYDLVWDDLTLVEGVERARDEGGLSAVVVSEFRLDPARPTGYYRPVALASLWLDRVLSGDSPIAHHASNIALHAACAALVAAWAAAWFASRRAGLLAGTWFAAHPAHVESVAFVSGRTDLWALLFTLLAVFAWRRGASGSGPGRRRFILASAVAVALAGFSKEVAFVAPVALVAWGLLTARSREAWRELRPWAAAWCAAIAVVLLTRLAVGIDLTLPGAGRPPLLDDPSFGLGVVTRSLAVLTVPWPLHAMWERAHLALTPRVLVSALAGLVLFVGAARLSGSRVALACAAWFLVFLVPVSGVAPIDAAPFAERFLYLPSAGFCLLAGAFAARRVTFVAAMAATVAFAGGTLARMPVWKNEVALFESIAVGGSRNAAMWDNLGQAYDAQGRSAEAERAYREALRLDPSRASAWNGLGVMEQRRGRLVEAERALREAIRLDPAMPHPRFNLAFVCLARGDRACAEEQRRALASTAPEAAERIAAAKAAR